MAGPSDTQITLEQMRRELYSAVVSDALAGMGHKQQSPRIALPPLTGIERIIGRCRTTLWVDMAHADPVPYELELQVVDACGPDDVLICAAGGSMRSGIWGELLSTAARNSGCVGAIVDGAGRDVAKMRARKLPVCARGTCVYDSQEGQRAAGGDLEVESRGGRPV